MLRLAAFLDLGFRASAPLPRQRAAGTDAPESEPLIQPPSATVRENRLAPWIVPTLLATLIAAMVGAPRLPDGETTSLRRFPFLALTGVLVGSVIALGILATVVHYLRGFRNKLYWELACWTLVVIGIAVRQLVASNSAELSVGTLAVAAVVGVAVLPGLMRWLNRISREPGLAHVAVPFSLGFFLDLAQVLTSQYVVPLPWVPR